MLYVVIGSAAVLVAAGMAIEPRIRRARERRFRRWNSNRPGIDMTGSGKPPKP